MLARGVHSMTICHRDGARTHPDLLTYAPVEGPNRKTHLGTNDGRMAKYVRTIATRRCGDCHRSGDFARLANL